MLLSRSPGTYVRPDWKMFWTGGLLTAGGLGWCLRLAYAEKPQAAIISYVVSSAGIFLMNRVLYKMFPLKKFEGVDRNFCMFISGGILFGFGYGWCLYVIKNFKSSLLAFAVGSTGCVLTNVGIYSMSKIDKRKVLPNKLSNEEIWKMATSANAGVHYMASTDECQDCKEYVDAENRKRAAENKYENRIPKSRALLGSIRKLVFPIERYNSEPISDTNQDENVEKDQSVRKETEKSSAKKLEVDIKLRRRLLLNDKDEAYFGRPVENLITCAPDTKMRPKRSLSWPKRNADLKRLVVRKKDANKYRKKTRPMTVPNTFEDETIIQNESELVLAGTQRKESHPDILNESVMEEPITTDSLSEVEGKRLINEGYVKNDSSFVMKEVAIKDKLLKLEHGIQALSEALMEKQERKLDELQALLEMPIEDQEHELEEEQQALSEALEDQEHELEDERQALSEALIVDKEHKLEEEQQALSNALIEDQENELEDERQALSEASIEDKEHKLEEKQQSLSKALIGDQEHELEYERQASSEVPTEDQ